MKDKNKTQKQPTKELTQLRRRIAELEASGRKRNQFEEALRQSEEKYRTILENIEDGYYEVDLAGNFTFFNDAMCRIQGYPRDELMGMNNRDYMDKETAKKVYKIFNTVLRTGKSATISDWQIIRKDGSLRDVESSVSLIRDANRNPVGFRGVIRDITERKRTEEALKESEQRFRTIFEGAIDGILLANIETKKFHIGNTMICTMLGYTLEEIKNLGVKDIHPKEALPFVMQQFDKLARGEITKTSDLPVKRKDGSVFYAEISSAMLKLDAGTYLMGTFRDVTERKQAEHALQESEERFRLAFENANTGVCLVDLEGNLARVNNKMCEIFGYTKEELERMTVNDIAHPADIDKSPEFIQKTLQGEIDRATFEKRYIHKKGHVVTCEVSSTLVRNAEGAPLYFISHVHDITDRKRVEENLEKEREDLNLIIDSSPIIVFYKDNEGRFKRVNKTFAKVLKMPEGDFVGKTVFDLYSPQIAQGMTDDDKEVFQSQRPKLSIIEKYESSSGIRWAQTDKIPIFDKHGLPIGLIGFAQDITDRKQAEAEIRESQQRFQGLVETLSDWIWEVDQSGIYTYVSPKIRDLLGYEPAEILGKTPFDLMPPEEAERVKVIFESLVAAQQPIVALENTNRHKDGRLIVFETSAAPFFNVEGQFMGYRGVDRDITARKQVEEALRERQETINAIIETSQDWIWAIDRHGVHTYSNPASEKILGYRIGEIVGSLSLNLIHEDDKKIVESILQECQEKRCGWNNLLLRWRHKNGTYRYLESNAVPILNAKGDLIGFRGVDRDITERKQAEEALRQSEERMKSIFRAAPIGIGVVANRVLMDINTRICEMTGYSREELVGSSARIVYPTQADFDYVGTEKYRQIAEKGTGAVETRWMKKDGTIIDVLLSSTPLDLSDLSRGVTFTALDITDRKRTEERYQTIIHTTMDGFVLMDMQGHFKDVNEAYCDIIGYSRDELLTMAIPDVEAIETPEDTAEHIRKIKEVGYDRFETRQRRRDGDIKDVEVSAKYMPTDGGLMIGFYRDITERKQAEEKLRESEEKYRDLVENINDILYATDEKGIVTYVSPAIESLSGYAPSEIIGRSFFEFLYREDVPYMMEQFQRDASGDTEPHEYRMVNKAGDVRWVRTSSRPLFRETRFVGFRGTMTDITDRKQAEEAVKRGYEQLQETFHATISALASTVEMKDQYTAGHQPRVTKLACAIAEEMGLPAEQIEGIRMSASIHDIGKIMVPAEILNKPGPLTEIQYEMIKMHPRAGYDILKGLKLPWPVAQIILQHHERMDGSGYPQGLSGDEIMLEARILTVANVVEAMNAHRPYRPAHHIKVALAEIAQNRGIFYDSAVVDACLRLFTEKGFILDSVPG
ncbi:MAG: PAS domain S-box protein [Deltaproteobacteria bacterium]|nr:PAS domain S-box protein [Deltaproteobacteria bacterium]